VALSRHRDQVLLFASRRSPQDGQVHSRPSDAVDRLRRVTAKLAPQAQSTATHGDDRPALDDLRVAPKAADRGRGDDDGADPTRRPWRAAAGSLGAAAATDTTRTPTTSTDGNLAGPTGPQPERKQTSRQRRDPWGRALGS
jgi:hypothetical protein